MRQRTGQDWFPFWVDKWIFGSTRIELTVEERAIWVDLMALGSKDDGYIRANQTTPYSVEQLAGMLIIPKDKLQGAIAKFKTIGKITSQDGILYIPTWETYRLSPRHQRRFQPKRPYQKGHNDPKSGQDSEQCGHLKEKEKEKEKEKDTNNDKEIDIYDYWNTQNIVIHDKITNKMVTKIRSCRKDYSVDQIKEAIGNYAEVISHPDKYYFTYKWTLADFLSRGIEKFLTNASPLINYLIKEIKNGRDNRTSAKFKDHARGPGYYAEAERNLLKK